MKEKLIDYILYFVADNNWWDENVAEQTRAFFTTLCFIGNVIVDTAECDDILMSIWNRINDEDYDEFENFMIKYIV